MRFLSFSNDKEDAEKEAKLKEAAEKIEQAIARERSLNELVDCSVQADKEEPVNLENDTRSLYERLQEQRNKKKESIEEAQKLSNFVAQLDEDDANYLNEVAKNRREEELRKRLEVQDALEAKKRLDEQKMEDQERRMREALLGTSSGSGRDSKVSSKSRLSSMIKAKPKVRPKGEMNSDGAKKEEEEAGKQPDSSPRSSEKRASDSPSQSNKRPTSNQRDERDSSTSHEDDGKRGESLLGSQQEGCRCTKNVMQTLGVMPSSLIVRENPKDSDESDNSEEDTICKLLPMNRRKRR